MNTPQFPGWTAQAHLLGELPQNYSSLGQGGMAERTSTSTDEHAITALIDRLADWVYYQNELEFE